MLNFSLLILHYDIFLLLHLTLFVHHFLPSIAIPTLLHDNIEWAWARYAPASSSRLTGWCSEYACFMNWPMQTLLRVTTELYNRGRFARSIYFPWDSQQKKLEIFWLIRLMNVRKWLRTSCLITHKQYHFISDMGKYPILSNLTL